MLVSFPTFSLMALLPSLLLSVLALPAAQALALQGNPLNEAIALPHKRSVNFTPSWGKRSAGVKRRFSPNDIQQEQAVSPAEEVGVLMRRAALGGAGAGRAEAMAVLECNGRQAHLEGLLRRVKDALNQFDDCVEAFEIQPMDELQARH